MFPTKMKGKPMKLVAGVESVLRGILHTQGRSTASSAGFTGITNDNKKTISIDRWQPEGRISRILACIFDAAKLLREFMTLSHSFLLFICSGHHMLVMGTH